MAGQTSKGWTARHLVDSMTGGCSSRCIQGDSSSLTKGSHKGKPREQGTVKKGPQGRTQNKS